MHVRLAVNFAGVGLAGLVLTACGGATPAPSTPAGEAAVIHLDGVTPVAPVKAPAKGEEGDGAGTRQKGEEGEMGEPVDPHIARQAALQEAAEHGILGLLSAGSSDLTGVIGGLVSAGNDKGLGSGGLGLSGIGAGGGGRGEGIGLGSIGTIGHGGGTGTGYGIGSGGVSGAALTMSGVAVLDMGDCATLGISMDQAVRAIRGRAYSLRVCYEDGLRKKPMEGAVAFRLVVGKGGNIEYVREIRSDLGSKEVAACLAKELKGSYVGQPSGGLFGVIETEMTFRPVPKK